MVRVLSRTKPKSKKILPNIDRRPSNIGSAPEKEFLSNCRAERFSRLEMLSDKVPLKMLVCNRSDSKVEMPHMLSGIVPVSMLSVA